MILAISLLVGIALIIVAERRYGIDINEPLFSCTKKNDHARHS